MYYSIIIAFIMISLLFASKFEWKKILFSLHYYTLFGVVIIFEIPQFNTAIRLDEIVFIFLLLFLFYKRIKITLNVYLFILFVYLIHSLYATNWQYLTYSYFGIIKLALTYDLYKYIKLDLKSIIPYIRVILLFHFVIAFLQFNAYLDVYTYASYVKELRLFESSSILAFNTASLGVTTIICFTLLFKKSSILKDNLINIAYFILSFVTVLMTNNRASLIGLLLLFFIMMLIYGNKKILFTALAFSFFLGALILDLNISEDFKIIDILEVYSSDSRIESGNSRLDALLKYPEILIAFPISIFSGIGLNQWQYDLIEISGISSAHNQIYNLFVEFGLFSLGFIYLTIRVYKQINSRFKILFICLSIISLTADYFLPRAGFEGLSFLILITLLIKDENNSTNLNI